MPDYPYELARLVNADKPICDDPNQRWYISFWIWDVQKGKKVRKRDYEVNNYNTIKERNAFAKTRIREINKYLAEGWHIDAVKKKSDTVVKNYNPNMKILDALKLAKDIKDTEARTSTKQNRLSVYTMFENFIKQQNWQNIPARNITQADILLFFDQLRLSRAIENVTFNGYLGKLSPLFTTLKDRKIIDINPCSGINKLTVTKTGRNIAYTNDQVVQLKAAIQDKYPELWDFVQFMFYGFIRPNEIRQLTVGMVNLDAGHIYIPPEVSKNKRAGYVKISPPFRESLLRLKVDNRPADELIFYRHWKGYNILLPENYMSQLHLEITRELKYGDDYTLYSWKHTGVVHHYRAGVDIKSLQEQLRHATLMETDIYLKSLGLFENHEIVLKSPAI